MKLDVNFNEHTTCILFRYERDKRIIQWQCFFNKIKFPGKLEKALYTSIET